MWSVGLLVKSMALVKHWHGNTYNELLGWASSSGGKLAPAMLSMLAAWAPAKASQQWQHAVVLRPAGLMLDE